MHVGLFIDVYYPIIDGVVKVTEAYASRLVKKCDVTVFAPCSRNLEPGYDDRFPYRVVRCKSVMRESDTYPQGFPHFDPAFMKQVRDSKLDIIHFHSAYTLGLYAKLFARRHDIALVGSLHSDFKPDVIEHMGKLLGSRIVKLMMSEYNACDECWVASDAIGNMFRRDYGLKCPTRVVPLSSDHRPVEDVAAARQEINAAFGLADEVFVMAHVGRQDLQKREDFILRSLAALKERLTNFKMIFVGEGGKQEQLKKLAHSLGLEENVLFCGKIAEPQRLMKLYARTDLLLFPSESDTYGLVKIEAACQKTPTLFVEGSMASDGIAGDINGFTAPNSEEAYAARIFGLYNDRGHLRRVGEGAFRELYSTWDEVVDEVYGNYCRIIENHIFAKK